MHRLVCAVAALAFTVVSLPARAEDPLPVAAPTPSPVVEVEPAPMVEEGPTQAPAPASQQEALQLYEAAFAAAVAGRNEEALATVAQLRARYPDTGAAELGAELARQLEAQRGNGRLPMADSLRRRLDGSPAQAAASGAPSAHPPSAAGTRRYATLKDALHDEQPTLVARAEFVVFQTLHGMSIGSELCGILNGCGLGNTLVPLLTGGAAAWAALAFSGDGITAGHALAIDSGVLWGAWHGLAFAGISNTFNSGTLGVVVLSQLAGMAAGHFAWAGLGLSAGDMSLMNSAGIWTAMFTLLATGALGVQGSTPGLFALLLTASDVGLVGGALLTRVLPMSRGRTLVIDAGIILGGLLGFAVQAAFLGASTFQVTAGSLLAGGLAGMVTAGVLTRDWDLELLGAPKVQVGLAPTVGGGAQLVIGGRL
ncbi:MAG: hypothetical protein RL653_7 [Pseudomonadota bacterium]|jgi:hypothetical protein